MTIFEGAYAQLSPSPKHEVRAVWLATIGGIDWPRTKAHSPSSIEAQKRELTATLDRLKAANFNTVILQTRIRATVIYPSSLGMPASQATLTVRQATTRWILQ